MEGNQNEAEEKEKVPETDTQVAYRLYRNTGKSINLSDWNGAFSITSFIEPSTLKSLSRVKTIEELERTEVGEEEDLIPVESRGEGGEEEEGGRRRKQARFLRAVGELGYVGFISSTGKKSEHVVKAVF